MELRSIRLTGEAIADALEDLGALRIRVFRDFPYLYEGDMAYERDYLQRYVNTPRAFLFAVYDGEIMVGATTCIPLEDETDEIRQPFLDNGMQPGSIMYFGESILLPDYRGQGLGHRFFDEREAYTQSLNVFKTACFCSVVRPENHPMQPADYRSNDVFWDKRGYVPAPELTCYLEWPDIGQTESDVKPLVFRLKHLS